MAHPLVLALYSSASAAAGGARTVHSLGISRDQISVISRNHREEGALAEAMDATPGADIEDSRTAGVLGELSGYVFAAMAIVMPGIGPIVAAGPLAATLGEAVGHAAGGVSSVLRDLGIDERQADAVQSEVEKGAVLLGIHLHTGESDAGRVREQLAESGATWVALAVWNNES